jgi:hypothetical protein
VFDWQNVVVFTSVRNEESGSTHLGSGCHKAAGEGDHMSKHVAIDKTNGEGVGSTVGESCDLATLLGSMA